MTKAAGTALKIQTTASIATRQKTVILLLLFLILRGY